MLVKELAGDKSGSCMEVIFVVCWRYSDGNYDGEYVSKRGN